MKRKVKLSMLRLRPYNKDDAETILTWIKDEKGILLTNNICPLHIFKRLKKSI